MSAKREKRSQKAINERLRAGGACGRDARAPSKSLVLKAGDSLSLTASQIKKIPGARKAAMPEFVAPQLATLVREPPSGTEWLHELKFDGYRIIYHFSRGKARFWSRNGKDWTEKFPNLAAALKSFPAVTAILDGEVVVVDKAGRSSFQRLQQSMGRGGKEGKGDEVPAFVFEIFDLIYLD